MTKKQTLRHTESVRIDMSLLGQCTAIADKEGRTIKAQLERFIRIGLSFYNGDTTGA